MCDPRTLEERAERLFSTKGVPLEALDPSLFARSKHPQVCPLTPSHPHTLTQCCRASFRRNRRR